LPGTSDPRSRRPVPVFGNRREARRLAALCARDSIAGWRPGAGQRRRPRRHHGGRGRPSRHARHFRRRYRPDAGTGRGAGRRAPRRSGAESRQCLHRCVRAGRGGAARWRTRDYAGSPATNCGSSDLQSLTQRANLGHLGVSCLEGGLDTNSSQAEAYSGQTRAPPTAAAV